MALIARNQTRASIRSIIDYVEDDRFGERNYVQVHNRLDYLKEQWPIFIEQSNLLRRNAADDAAEKVHADIFTEIEPLYLETKSILESRLNELTAAANASAPNNQPAPPINEPREIVVRIDQPKRDIENTWGEFNGNFTKWRGFCDLFTSRVHNDESMSSAHKFRLLKNSLKGNAAAALGDWELSDDNYLEAWNRLKELYEQTYLTGNKLVQRLLALPKLDKAIGANIQKMSNVGNEVYRQLRALRYPTENIDFMFIFILHDRLDDETSLKWNLERKSDFPQLVDFFGFLDRQARALITSHHDVKKSNTNEERKRISVADQAKFNAKRSKQDDEAKQAKSFKCVVCQGSHTIYKCDAFLKMNLSKRNQFIKTNNLCLNCLKAGHRSKECNARECTRCNVKHSNFLCKENPLNKSNESTPAKSTPAKSAQVVTRSGRVSKARVNVSNAQEAEEQN